MFRYVIVALMLTTGSAYASCYTPELEISADTEFDQDYSSYHSSDESLSFGISLNIPLGKTVSDLCAAEVAQARADLETEYAEKAKKIAEGREKKARALAQELDNLEQKIAICSGFELETAPGSIKNLCGDLLQ